MKFASYWYLRSRISFLILLILQLSPCLAAPNGTPVFRGSSASGTAIGTQENPSQAKDFSIKYDPTARARHLLSRISFGPTQYDLDRLNKLGIEVYLREQLNPQTISMPESLLALTRVEALSLNPAQMSSKYGRPVLTEMAKQRAQNRKDSAESVEMKEAKELEAKRVQKLIGSTYKKIYMDLAQAKIQRAIHSPRQLEELMTDFWFNHFNVSIDKGLDHILVGSYEESAIRPHVFGRFRDILGASSHHAAMLFYLDNWQNTAPDSRGARGKFKGLNENFARELLELHTLGVDGGYSQKDVVELARVLTGLGLPNRQGFARRPELLNSKDGSRFDSNRHDFGEKVLLGKKIRGSGAAEIEEALDMLAKHPSTARHISYKLAQYFVTDNPAESLVQKLSSKYLATDGDIRSVLLELFNSAEFWDPAVQRAKFKTPLRYAISSLRATDAQLSNIQPLVGFLKQSGMPLYQCQTPDGYKVVQSAWLSPDNLLNRINFATGIGSGRVPGLQLGQNDYRLVANTSVGTLSKTTSSAIEGAARPLRMALVLGSPEFMMY